MANEITTQIRGNAMIITFNRPDRGNAMTGDMAHQLFQTLKQVTVDRAVRAVMLRGAGGTFMDGMELGLYAGSDFNAGLERNSQMIQNYHSAIRELHVMDKPVLAVVEGKVSGAGLSLMLAADLVLAGSGTQFSGGFTEHAMTPDGGATFFLTRKCGAAKATEILMLGQPFDAATAERLTLVNAVVDSAKLEEEALNSLDRLTSGPTKAYGGIKRLVAKAFEQDLHAQLALEHTYWGASSRSFDFRDAIKAYFAKRPPKFSGS